MGAEYCEEIIKAASPEDLQDEFDDLVRREAWEFGHGGYTGSFAEKDGVEVIEKENGFWDVDDAELHCREGNDKWGPASAYLIAKGEYYVGGWCSS